MNQDVLVRKEGSHTLKPAKVSKICERPRSYELTSRDGSKIERNRRAIHKSSKNPLVITDDYDDYSDHDIHDDHSENPPEGKYIDMSCTHHAGLSSQNNTESDCGNARPARQRKIPGYLKDYVC
ncbi:hypothetical protein QAD02_021350 [Eretmocerus hayati]|uniref:Uncharacterized protein n=1 Tax=Eretmocerus hayati TaxID=131215 RepID=A0ACC2PT68_9HYME|nr:hypothetical protein QAD02_021350 [Eretmocerus hayati]